MTERPGDDDELDPSDWLASQFDATGEVKKPAAPAPTPTPTTPEPPTTPPAVVAPATTPPAPPPPPPPVAAPPAPPAEPAGGFSWGLQPAAAQGVPPPATPSVPPTPPVVPPPVAPPPASAPPVPPPLIEPPATVAMTPPPVAPTPPPVDPWDQPTQALEAMPAELAAPSLPAPPPPASAVPPVAEPAPDPYAGVAAAELLGAASLAAEPGATSPLDALFGDENFRDYDAEPAPPQSPFARAAAEPAPDAASPGHTRITGTQRVLLAVAGGLVALLALAALFLLGTRLGGLMAPAAVATPSASPSPSPSPTPTVEPVGPVAPGVWAWDELRGGECLDPYTDPWAEEFTVVDCAAPHPAQMVVRGTYPPSAEGVTDDPYPGAEVLQGQLSLLCTAPGVIDLAVAGQYPDVQFQGAYPATAEQWDAGNRYYYCFVSRSSGEPLTGSIAVPPPVPAG